MSKGYWGLQKVSTWALDPSTSLIKLKDGTVTLGRANENYVKCKSIQVSRNHCSIKVENGRVYIKDNKSFNGTFIGDIKLPPLREVSLEDGDVIGIGAHSAEPLCHYVFKLIFFPPESETSPRVSSVGDSSINQRPQEKQDEKASSVKSKGEELENEDMCRKRIAISPPPVPIKIPRRLTNSSTTEEDTPNKTENMSNRKMTLDQSENKNSLIDNCVTMCLNYSIGQNDHCTLNREGLNHKEEDCFIIEKKQPDVIVNVINKLEIGKLSKKSNIIEKREVNNKLIEKPEVVEITEKQETIKVIDRPKLSLHSEKTAETELHSLRFASCLSVTGKKFDKSVDDNSTVNAPCGSRHGMEIVEIFDSDKIPCSQLFKPKNEVLDTTKIKISRKLSNLSTKEEYESTYPSCTKDSMSNGNMTLNQSKNKNSLNNFVTESSNNSHGQIERRIFYKECVNHNEDEDCFIIKNKPSEALDIINVTNKLEVTDNVEKEKRFEQSKVLDKREVVDQTIKKLEVVKITEKSETEVTDELSENITEAKLNPFSFVSIRKNIGRKTDRRSIDDNSIMNNSSFSQADEEIVEIIDINGDDDDVPCSQLFKPEEEVVIDVTKIKEEVEDECELNDSDVEIIEEECSFFEDHFSQNYRETSPRKEEKLSVQTNIVTETVADPREVAENKLELEKRESVSCFSNNSVDERVKSLVSSMSENVSSDNISKEKIEDLKDAIISDNDPKISCSSKSNSSKDEGRQETKLVQDQSISSNKIMSSSSNKLDYGRSLITNDVKAIEKKSKYNNRLTSLLCEALPLPSKKRQTRNNIIQSEKKLDPKQSKIMKKSPKQKTKETISKKVKKNIAKERKEKLKQLSVKDKNCTEKDTMSTSAKHNPPNCAKITNRNRGSFLTDTVCESGQDKGNKTSKKVSPVTRLPKLLIPPVKDKEENKETPECFENNRKKNQQKEERLDSNVSNTDPQTELHKIKQRISKNADKKSVRFRDQNLVEVREYECDGILNKIQHKVKDLMIKVDDVTGTKKYVEGIPNTFMETVYFICKWNAVWLEECKRFEGEPPVADLMVPPLKESFMNYSEYQKIFTTMELFNLWATTVQDLDVSKIHSYNVAVIHSEIAVIDATTSKTMQKLHCCALIGKNDITLSSFPKGGDFVVVQFLLKNENTKGRLNDPPRDQGKQIVSAFGYVTEHTRIVKLHHCRDTHAQQLVLSVHSSPSSKQKNLQLDSCVYFTLLIRQREKRVIDEKFGLKLKVLRNLNKDLRIFEGIGMLPFSPLSLALLDPVKYMFMPPSVHKKTSLFWQMPLNESQTVAVFKSAQSVFNKKPSISLIHGPPGTGKTNVIIALVLQILYSKKKESSRKQARPKILLCAPSNTAVDELVLRLMDVRKQLPANLKFKMVRHGRKKAMHPTVADISTEALAERELISNSDQESLEIELSLLRAQERAISMTLQENPSDASMEKYKDKYMSIQQQIINMEKLSTNGVNQKNSSNVMNHQLRRQMKDIETRVLLCADIIATTLSSSFSNQMKEAFIMKDDKFNKKFACCIVDEATQASEPESLQPLLFNIENMILVGDPQQLPATVISSTAKNLGLGRSLFARLFSAWSSRPDPPVYKLNVQYRMHPEIARWPSSYFYCNQLMSAPNLETERNSRLVPYTVFTHNSKQDQMGESNTGESIMVSNLVKSIQMCQLFKDMSIGIIVPYQKQKNIILNTLSSMKLEGSQLIMVQTIDSYQGQEKDIVILSCVRTEGVGFLADPHRLNVALTRAKSSLIIFANFSSLQGSNAWNCMLNDAKKRSRVTELRHSQLNGDDLLNLLIKNNKSKGGTQNIH